MTIGRNRSIQERREEFARERKELLTRALATTDLSELARIAQRYGELCDGEDTLLLTAPSRPE